MSNGIESNSSKIRKKRPRHCWIPTSNLQLPPTVLIGQNKQSRKGTQQWKYRRTHRKKKYDNK